jgi:hypothetical protein
VTGKLPGTGTDKETRKTGMNVGKSM